MCCVFLGKRCSKPIFSPCTCLCTSYVRMITFRFFTFHKLPLLSWYKYICLFFFHHFRLDRLFFASLLWTTKVCIILCVCMLACMPARVTMCLTCNTYLPQQCFFCVTYVTKPKLIPRIVYNMKSYNLNIISTYLYLIICNKSKLLLPHSKNDLGNQISTISAYVCGAYAYNYRSLTHSLEILIFFFFRGFDLLP